MRSTSASGLIDVSTLGCLDVRGPDVAKLLDRVYINGWSNLKVGRTRYGVMCDDAGIIFDDGTCARLAEDRYYLTATTSGADTVYQWLQFWLAESPWDVCVTNVTSGYGAVNLAGPRARDVLAKVTAINLDSAVFPYLGCAQGVVAGVPCILFRIGFVGELGYEIHFPAEYGDHMWDALMEAGKDFGISPFGVESQRILRLEKQHIIVTQDTDALSNPLEANLAWAVKFDKPDFVGKRALLAVREAGLRNQLVGFVAAGSQVPDEGAQVDGERPVRRPGDQRAAQPLPEPDHRARVGAAGAGQGRRADRDPRRPGHDRRARGHQAVLRSRRREDEGMSGGPLKRSSVHHLHVHERAKFAVQHGWEIAASFGDAGAEKNAALQAVALADVSWLGKLECKGPWAASLASQSARRRGCLPGDAGAPSVDCRTLVSRQRQEDAGGSACGAAAMLPDRHELGARQLRARGPVRRATCSASSPRRVPRSEPRSSRRWVASGACSSAANAGCSCTSSASSASICGSRCWTPARSSAFARSAWRRSPPRARAGKRCRKCVAQSCAERFSSATAPIAG